MYMFVVMSLGILRGYYPQELRRSLDGLLVRKT